MTNVSICEHFGFSAIPFLKTPKNPFIHASFAQNLEIISNVFFTRQVAVVTGAYGSGKSSLMYYASNRLDPSSHRIVSCELSDPNKKGIYRFLANKCGIHPSFYADDVKMQLIDFFESENRQGRQNCLILDEAQSLSVPMLAEVRSFYEESGSFSLVLVGLPSLFTDKLDLAVNTPMKRRVSILIHAESISLQETKDYIAHHLSTVKAKNQLFDEKCFPSIHSKTNGIPGNIDQLCATSIFEAFKNKIAVINEDIIEDCAQKIRCS